MTDTHFAHPHNDTNYVVERSATFTHPDDVLQDRSLTVAEKRTILASWASDAHVVPNQPAMRQLDSGAIVSIDAVLTALRALDAQSQPGNLERKSATRLRHGAFKPRWLKPGRSQSDDDDDPPPSPVVALAPGVELALRRRLEKAWGLLAA
jgi:hypothetical protein